MNFKPGIKKMAGLLNGEHFYWLRKSHSPQAWPVSNPSPTVFRYRFLEDRFQSPPLGEDQTQIVVCQLPENVDRDLSVFGTPVPPWPAMPVPLRDVNA